ncbi:MAG TPA: radical SAM protein [Acidobacteriota bacterium]|jgi:7-carboxy-7-deazaguanine synthase|nr:radical SAM protein [Acidobacteriota bacterium]
MSETREISISSQDPSANSVDETLTVNEIFYSIQGESSYAGLPCVFVRLTECNLRCAYCDTEYAFYEGTRKSLRQVLDEVGNYQCDLIEVTGGEPLLQPAVNILMRQLIGQGKKVLLETGGSLDISQVPNEVTIILDIKTPGSGMERHNLWSNLDILKPTDQIKFVVCDRKDYEWARQVIRDRKLEKRSQVLISPVYGSDLSQVAAWILEDNLKVRFQIQLHKWIWGPDARGV